MNNKNIIIAGAIAVGLYLFLQTKTTTQKAAQKVAPKRIGQPTTQAARIAALRKAAVRKAAAQKIAQKIAQKVAQKVVKEKDEYVRERTPPTLAATIQKRTGTPLYEARRIAEKIAYGRARKQRERIAAARRAVLERARRKRIEIAEANRKAAARKNLIHRAVKVLPGVSLHNILNIIKPPHIKKTTPKVASPTMHKTTHSSWTPTAWPVYTIHKKSTLFNYSKPQKKKDLSALHTAIKWRRAMTPPRPKSRARKITQKIIINKSSTDKRKKMQEILSRRKHPLYWLRPRPHVVVRRR